MMLTKRDRNKIYEAIELYGLDPGEFNLEDSGDKVTITHSSGSVFEFSCRSKRFPTREFDLERYLIKASVPDGIDETSNAAALIARAPRKIVARYSYLANVAHYTQLAKEKADPGYPPRGLPYDLAGLIEMTIAILIEHLWHPVSKRRHIKRGIWLIDRAIGRTKEKHPDFAWNVQIFTSRTVTKEPGIRGIIHRFAARVSGLWMRFWSWLKR